MVGALAREVRLKLLLFEVTGVGRNAALLFYLGQVPLRCVCNVWGGFSLDLLAGGVCTTLVVCNEL